MSSAALINASLGPFVLREALSAGGIAEVYRAQHRDDAGRSYAVKVMRRERQAERHHVKAFEDEFAILQALKHPGVPTARRYGEVAGRLAMVMDLVPGETCAVHLARQRPIPGARILHDLCAIAAHLHGAGIVHNDLKLENLMWDAAHRTTLIDFGNVRRIAPGIITALFARRPARIFGTATYLAPELIAGKRPTPRSDAYALGVCAFFLLSGAPPFAARHQSQHLRANAGETPPAIGQRVAGLPPTAAQAIDRCLAKDPAERPADAAELLMALRPLAG